MRTPAQNFTAAAFSAYHEVARLNLKSISETTGISAGDLSRIRSGKKRMTFETLTKLIADMPQAQADLLVAAFMKDHCPPGFADRIEVVMKSQKQTKMSRYRQALYTLEHLESHPALRKHIISVAETLAHLLEEKRVKQKGR
jgi:DNA-binding Xre family transcriptional regulator